MSGPPTDDELARLAGPLRVLRLQALLAAGLTRDAIRHRVDQGRLQRLWPGVYLVGSTTAGPLSLAFGATQAFAADAYVDGPWGCFVHGFRPQPDLPVDILLPAGSRDRREGIRPHRSGTIGSRDAGVRGGIPVVSPARAILGVAVDEPVPAVEALIADAQIAKALTEADLRDVLDRCGRHPGAATLTAALADSPGLTRSEAERILRRLLKQAGLPQPMTDYVIGRYRADFAWPALKLIVELDSFAFHGHRRAFHDDRRRTAWLTAQGWSVLPVTAKQLKTEPFVVVARIAEAIARRSAA